MSSSGFDEREKGFEAKFHHDLEIQFKVTARRNKLLGLWAAGLLSLEGDDAEAYAKEVVASDFEEAGDADVVRKVMGDLADKGVDMTEDLLRREMDRLMLTARDQIQSEAKPDEPNKF